MQGDGGKNGNQTWGELEERQKKMLKLRAISLQPIDFQHDTILSAGCIYIIYGKEISKTRFFSKITVNTLNFESGFNNFGNICVNRW